MVLLGAVARSVAAHMAGDPLVLVIDLDETLAGPDQHCLAGVAVGDTVVMLFEGDMVVDVDFDLLDLQVVKRVCRQRLQGGFFLLLKQLMP